MLLQKALEVNTTLFLMGLPANQRAPVLQVLFANGDLISTFGAARGIKHLVLQMRNPHCGHLSAAMSVLEQLQTLWLASNGGEVQQQTGALRLSALKSLQSLALKFIVPESISCNDSCELHVELKFVWSMEHPVWDTVLSRLRTVQLFGGSTDLVALPSILLKAGNLTRAVVTVNQCGTATTPVPLGGHLAHVEELVLHGKEVHAVVPAHVTWRNLLVAATHMDLRFEAVASFGKAIPAFCFVFKTLQVRYPQPILNLFMAVTVNPAPKPALCAPAGCSAH